MPKKLLLAGIFLIIFGLFFGGIGIAMAGTAFGLSGGVIMTIGLLLIVYNFFIKSNSN